MYGNDKHDLKAKVRRLADAAVFRWHRYWYERKPPALSMTPHFLLRRKTLVILAVTILLLSAVLRPLSFITLLWGRRFVAILVAAFVIAALVDELAAICLGTKGRLWYTRRIAPVFVLVALAAIQTLLPVGDRLVARIFGIGPFFSSVAATHALLAVTLMWMALLR